jgi:polyphosphate kinase
MAKKNKKHPKKENASKNLQEKQEIQLAGPNEGKNKGKSEKKNKKSGKQKEKKDKLKNKFYENELEKLNVELVKFQYWIKEKKLKLVVIFEGRDAAGKGGVIKRITEPLNPRICRVVALGVPTEKEKTQWYFQRYIPNLPAGGEMVLFDRSWYNRAGVEHVMGFCTDEEYWEFLRSCPQFEQMLIRSGIILVKYWFSVSEEEQDKRFKSRIADRTRRWKFSEMDLECRNRWVEFSKAKDEMFNYCDTKESPWFVVEADDKKRARLNCIHHLLSIIPYKDLEPQKFELPPRAKEKGYVRPPRGTQTYVPDYF